MDQEEGHVTGPMSLLPPHQQQQQQQYHQNQRLANNYEYSDTAGEEDDEEDNGEDEDEEEEEEDNDENTTDHQQRDQHHPDDESNEVADEEDGIHDDEENDDNADDEAVFPPPVIAEISEDSQEYYMKPPEKMDDGPKPFRCDLCDKRFQEKSSVYRHIKEVHRKIIVLMGEDGRVAKVKSSPVHSCCGTTFTTRRALLRHQKSAACHLNNVNNAPVTAHQQDNGKRKRVNGMAGAGISSSKRNGTGMRMTATSSEEEDENRFDEEDSLDDQPEPDEEEDEESGSILTAAASSSSMGMPYRCPYGICPLFFTTKDIMINHLRTEHKMRMELVSITASSPSGLSSPMSLGTTTTTTGLTSTTISMTDKRFPCSVFGCQAAFTRKDRLNLHIRTRHANSSGGTSSHSGFMSGLKVKLPSIQHQDHRIRNSSSSGARSSVSSSSHHVNGPIVTRPPKETIHPKKHACDYPGCEKAYTKNSHVKRHKLSAHPDLFPQSNGRISDTPLLTTTSLAAQRRQPHQVNVLNPDDDGEEEDDDEDQDAGGSDDDNFEVFDDQDDEPVMRRGRNIVPRIAPTLKSSFLSLTSNKSNGNRRKK